MNIQSLEKSRQLLNMASEMQLGLPGIPFNKDIKIKTFDDGSVEMSNGDATLRLSNSPL